METMDNLFETPAAVNAEVKAAPAANEERKAQVQVLKSALQATLAKDKDFASHVKTLSGAVRVVNSLGFGATGNIVVDKTNTTERAVVPTSTIVGYRIENIGSEAIPYKTCTCTKGADGLFSAEPIDAVLQPGATADLTRQYMTMFCATPEISFVLANGRLCKNNRAKAANSTKATLEAFFFKFDKEENRQINDDDVKLRIADEAGKGHWVVKPEYEATFGELNNPTEKEKPARAKSGPTYDATVAAANYVYTVIMGN